MTRLFNSILKTTFPQYNFPSIRPQSATVTKVQNLCNSLSRASPFARNPRGLLKHSYSNCVKGVSSVLSGLVLSSYLGVRQAGALCAPKDAGNDLENLPSQIHGYTRKELKEKKPNLFESLYTEGFKKLEKGEKLDLILKAKAFQELLEIGEEVVKEIKGKDVCIVLGAGGSGKSTLISWLTGSKMKREKAARGAYYVYDVDPSQTTPSSTRICHDSSGTCIPIAVKKDSLTLVDMPGMKDTRGKWITIVNSILLEKIINGAKSVSFTITVGADVVTSNRGEDWKELFEVIIDSLGYRKKEIIDFELDKKDQSPIMILVNFTKNYNSIEIPTDEALKTAQDLLNEDEEDPKCKIGDLAYVYSPQQSSEADVYKKLLSLKRVKHDVKVVPTSDQIQMSLDDMNAFEKRLTKTLKNIPNDCTIEYFEKTLNDDIIPCLKYCGILCDFTEVHTVEKYNAIRLTFEKKLFKLLGRWIDEAIDNKEQQDAKKIADLILKILGDVEITPYLINSIVEKLSPDVLSKSSPHVAGGLTLLASIGIGAAAATVPAAVVTAIVATFWNAIKADQKLVHFFGDQTKKRLPILPNWSHEKPKLEYLSGPYEKVFSMASEKEAKFGEKRDSERGKVKSLLKEIDALLSANYLLLNEHYHRNKGEITFYLKNEDDFYDDLTKRIVDRKALSLQSSSTNPGELEETKEYYNKMHDRLHEMIKLFISKDEKYFKYFNATDKDEVVSKIKSLKVRMKRLDSAQRDFIDHGVVKKQVEISKSSVDRISRSWVESVAKWTKESVEETVRGWLFAKPEKPEKTL